jgi:hypothetical protein
MHSIRSEDYHNSELRQGAAPSDFGIAINSTEVPNANPTLRFQPTSPTPYAFPFHPEARVTCKK